MHVLTAPPKCDMSEKTTRDSRARVGGKVVRWVHFVSVARSVIMAIFGVLPFTIILGGLFGSELLSYLGFEFSVEGMENLIEAWGLWGCVLSVLLMVLHSFIPFPAEILAVANGMIFGPLWGFVLTWIGAMLGACLAFGLSRALGRPFAEAVLSGRHIALLDHCQNRGGTLILFLSRFIPVISFNLVNYAAGLTNVSWWTFVWTTGVGILPVMVLMVGLGGRVTDLPWQASLAVVLGAAALVLIMWRLATKRWQTVFPVNKMGA